MWVTKVIGSSRSYRVWVRTEPMEIERVSSSGFVTKLLLCLMDILIAKFVFKDTLMLQRAFPLAKQFFRLSTNFAQNHYPASFFIQGILALEILCRMDEIEWEKKFLNFRNFWSCIIRCDFIIHKIDDFSMVSSCLKNIQMHYLQWPIYRLDS